MPRPSAALVLSLVFACGGDDAADDGGETTSVATSSAEASTTAPTTGVAADVTGDELRCGDGVVSAGEACDDGNRNDLDGCSNTCILPTCDDGQRNGDESDVDCGGACSQCGDMATCNHHEDCTTGLCDRTCVGLYPTCLEMHMWHASLPDGVYDLDPDGDGVPVPLFCDMVGGGWTEVGRDEFAQVAGWSAGTTSACGAWSSDLLGGAGQFGAGAATEKFFPLLGVPHKKVRVIADAIVIDSWDAESLLAAVDEQQVASIVCSQGIPASCGPKEAQCGAPAALEGRVTLRGELAHTADVAAVKFTSTLDMPADEEAWGLDRVVVSVQ